jgi:hypothetical protein
LALPLIGLPITSATANDRTLEFTIVSVDATGPVVRVRFGVPGSCWGWTMNRSSKRDTRILVSITGYYNGTSTTTCPKNSYIASAVFELPNFATEIADPSGKVWWSRPGAADFKLITGKAGTRALQAFVVYDRTPAPIAYEYDLVCKNGKKARVMKNSPKEAAVFKNLKKGAVCTISMRAVFTDSSVVKLESKPMLV